LKWILSPALYAASVPSVSAAFLFIAVGIYATSENVLAWVIGLLLALGAASSSCVSNVHGLRESSTHLRHCTILYAGLALLGIL
jgi:hypothetical protein